MTTTEEQATMVPPLAAFLRPQLPPAALYGLPGEVAVTLSEASGADPAAVLVSWSSAVEGMLPEPGDDDDEDGE